MIEHVNATDIVRAFHGKRALVIGDAMLDTYFEGSAERLCKEGPVPVVHKVAAHSAPGGAANSAANLRALGAEVYYVGLIGCDAAGATLRAALRAQGIDDRWLIEDESVETLHKLRVLADGHYVVRFDEGDTSQASLPARRKILAAVAATYPTCDLTIVADYCYGLVSDEVIDQLGRLRLTQEKVLAVDSKHVERYRQARATVVTPNLAEASAATGISHATADAGLHLAVEQIGHQLRAQLDADLIAITLAGDGVLLVDRGGRLTHLPAHPVSHAGDVGAGDSFTAAMALALASGAAAEQAAMIGIDAASIAVTKQRTAVVAHQELLRRAGLTDQTTIASAPDIAAALDADRFAGRTIVFTNGVFDILHAGHVQLLRRAKALGDVLVVGINSDASTRRLKGPSRPINSERDRVALVAALDAVDYAVVFDEDTPAELIRAFRPHIHVKGGDYTPEALPEAAAAREVGARIEILAFVEGRSTTGVIDRIVSLVHDGMIGVSP
jgi:D-beta-D-heptose 7-phosphate kinase/D-beta-D-heptose 1-phosphate adenosyltransferase